MPASGGIPPEVEIEFRERYDGMNHTVGCVDIIPVAVAAVAVGAVTEPAGDEVAVVAALVAVLSTLLTQRFASKSLFEKALKSYNNEKDSGKKRRCLIAGISKRHRCRNMILAILLMITFFYYY